jgi:DNA-binding LacI/PurR family transcriptional regulator
MHGDGCREGGFHAMNNLLALREPPTGVVCYNDMTAVGALRCLHLHKTRMPAGMSVVGFDSLPIASYLQPPLTAKTRLQCF